MHPFAVFLLITTLSIPTTTLVLRDGHRLDVDGTVRLENGRVIFRSAGALFTIPESEVDLEATKAAATPAIIIVRGDEPKQRLRVSEEERKRLLRDLEGRHDGKPASAQQVSLPATQPRTRAEKDAESGEEWNWRRRARGYEEAVRQAQENLDLLRSQAEELRTQIRGFVAIGYAANQFSYQTTRLAGVLEQIPYAEQDVTRTQRAYDQFRDDARRQGVLPGWLR